MVYVVGLSNGVVVSDDRERLDLDFVSDMLRDAYWAIGRSRNLTERSIAHCLCFGVYAPDGPQIGFARVITDYAIRAHVSDVIIEPRARGMGIGRGLISAILDHPELATVSQWTLMTSDAQALYERFGFRTLDQSVGRWMSLTRTVGRP